MFDQILHGRYRDIVIVAPLIAFFGALLCLSLGNVVTGDLGEFLSAGGMVAPIVILALLAYIGDKHRLVRYSATLLAARDFILPVFCHPHAHTCTGCPVLSRSGLP